MSSTSIMTERNDSCTASLLDVTNSVGDHLSISSLSLSNREGPVNCCAHALPVDVSSKAIPKESDLSTTDASKAEPSSPIKESSYNDPGV